MFSINGAFNAYHQSLNDHAVLEIERRIGVRSTPVVGGALSSIQQVGNRIARPVKVTGGFLFGHDEVKDPEMPTLPDAFKGNDLETAFNDSFRLKMQANKATVAAAKDLLHLNVTGYTQNSSVADYAAAKEARVVFVDESPAAGANLGNLVNNAPGKTGVNSLG